MLRCANMILIICCYFVVWPYTLTPDQFAIYTMSNVWSFALIILHLITDNSPSPSHIVTSFFVIVYPFFSDTKWSRNMSSIITNPHSSPRLLLRCSSQTPHCFIYGRYINTKLGISYPSLLAEYVSWNRSPSPELTSPKSRNWGIYGSNGF
jgi:hypothetical protein